MSPINRIYKAGSIIYFSGDAAESVFILQNGLVSLSYISPETQMEVRETIKNGEFFGVKSALGRFPREETAQVIRDAQTMVLTVPESPRLANSAEEHVWQRLTEQLLPHDLLVAGQRVTDHLKDHEIDFVVAIEGAGIVCVEVKGGEVWHDGTKWRQKRGDREFKIGRAACRERV